MSETLVIDGRAISLDKEGYLQNLEDWSPRVAVALAELAEIQLNEDHWEIITIMRNFHQQRGLSPVMRILVKLVSMSCGPEKGNSLYLLGLFPGSPAKLASRIAGLPRPSNCL
ncbi:MAG: TusE/DsrC/DsvC family sulfur relay protein [Pseudomonadales bacterium]|nr:TusE/DsrC/DsvC family sulfur relay protein [Pseudomonadales bacterium]